MNADDREAVAGLYEETASKVTFAAMELTEAWEGAIASVEARDRWRGDLLHAQGAMFAASQFLGIMADRLRNPDQYGD